MIKSQLTDPPEKTRCDVAKTKIGRGMRTGRLKLFRVSPRQGAPVLSAVSPLAVAVGWVTIDPAPLRVQKYRSIRFANALSDHYILGRLFETKDLTSGAAKAERSTAAQTPKARAKALR